MPRSNEEARNDLLQHLAARDLTITWLAGETGKHPLWVGKRLRGVTGMQVDDYWLMKNALNQYESRA